MQIPYVRGVGGSLIYFIEEGTQSSIWAHNFLWISNAQKFSGKFALAIARPIANQWAVPVFPWALRGSIGF
jgi:4-hydroxyphenylpyruvate dioxygenase-like putative hemolysin